MAFDNEHLDIWEDGEPGVLEIWARYDREPGYALTGQRLFDIRRDAADAFGRRLRQLGGGNFDLEEAFKAGMRAASRYDWDRIGSFEDFGPSEADELYRDWLRTMP